MSIVAHKLRRVVNPEVDFVYTGSPAPFRVMVNGTGTGTFNVPFSGFPKPKDVMILYVGVSYTTDLTITLASSGWTKVTEIYANDTKASNLAVFWKAMGPTPDTGVDVNYLTGGNAGAHIAWAHLLRNVDNTTPILNFETATKTNGVLITPPSITTTKNNTWTSHVMFMAHDEGGGARIYTNLGAFFRPSFTTGQSAGTNDGAMAIGYVKDIPGGTTISPPQMEVVEAFVDNTAYSAASIALEINPR